MRPWSYAHKVRWFSLLFAKVQEVKKPLIITITLVTRSKYKAKALNNESLYEESIILCVVVCCTFASNLLSLFIDYLHVMLCYLEIVDMSMVRLIESPFRSTEIPFSVDLMRLTYYVSFIHKRISLIYKRVSTSITINNFSVASLSPAMSDPQTYWSINMGIW